MTRAEHHAKAAQNRAFLASITDIDAWPQWAVTVAFYAALHTADQLLVTLGQDTGSHGVREHSLKTLHARTLWTSYGPLAVAAHDARYRSVQHFNAKYPPATIRNTFLGNYLPTIEREVEKQLRAIDES